MAGRRDALLVIWMVACAVAQSPPDSGPPPDDATTPEEPTTLPGCGVGQTRCTGNGVEACGSDGGWSGVVIPCDAQTCSNGSCTGVCVAEQTRCNGNGIETCNGMGQWTATQMCPVACCNSACVDTSKDTSNCGACGVACAMGTTCGTSFTAFTGSLPSGWTANGSATYDAADSAGQLTPATTGQAGSWVYGHPLLIDTVTVQFDFYIGGGTGADGMGMMLETNGPTAVGGGGGQLGIGGLTGFGVEIDEYNNAMCNDSNTNHIGIDSLAACGTNTVDLLAVQNAPGFTVADAAWHTMVVDIASNAFTVTANGTKQITSYTPTVFKGGNYYLGFGGGTGGATNYHRVRNVKVSFPVGHCF